MADVLTDNFESGALAQWTAGGAAPTIESTIKNNGSYSAKFLFTSYGASYLNITSLPTRKPETFTRFYFYLTAIPNALIEILLWNDASGNTHDLVVNTAGKMVFRRGSTAIASCANAIPLNTWILVQVRHKKSSTAGFHEIICNGETVTDTSNDASTNNSMVYRIGHGIGGAQAATFYYDDLVVSDSAYPGAISSTSPIAGLIASVSTVSGTLIGKGEMAGSIAAEAVLSSTLIGRGKVSGVISSVSTAAGNLFGKGKLIGAIDSTSVLAGTIQGKGILTGVVVSISEVAGNLFGKGKLIGTIDSISAVAGTIFGKGKLIGSIDSTSTVSGTVLGRGLLNGAINIVSGLSGTLVNKIADSLQGTIAAISNFSGTLRGMIYASGSIIGLSSLTGQLRNAAPEILVDIPGHFSSPKKVKFGSDPLQIFTSEKKKKGFLN